MSRQLTTIAQFFLLVLGVTAVLSLTVHAAPTSQEAPRPRFNLEEIPHNPSSNNEQLSESALSVTAPDILLSWSKVAFQSLRNGNWDIFVGNDDGTGQTAVVATGNSEIHPHLNRGNSKLVYASNSDGDYEIYTANIDGSGQAALTNNSTSDGNPSWSPDGNKIVFEAYRNGEADIYVMNANGSNQVRLTTHADFDGMPTWSPDGSKIAFVSRRTGGYRIYVMNADGSGQTQISNQPYSFRPQWSPDGSQIAYDADNDGDGWQDLWRMNADGTSQTQIYNPSGQTDAWASSWSPDGSRIVYTLISFINYQGNWYWTYAYPDAWGPNVGTTRLSSNGLDWDASWQTSDTTPPFIQLNEVPNYSRAGELLISWYGIDNLSGIKVYEVQYQNVANGEWVDWLTTNETSEYFTEAQIGETYLFRARALDNAFNANPWNLVNPYQTTFYTRYIRGEVSNNRGIPALDYLVDVNPSVVSMSTLHASHDYQAWLFSFGEHDVDITSSVYGSIPAASRFITENINLNTIMPPIDNVLMDSNFESGNFAGSLWNFTGDTLPSHELNEGHSGSWAMALGDPPPSYLEILADSCVRPPGDTGSPACNFTTIQSAVNAANFQDTVWVFPGFYQETISINLGINLRSVAGPFLTIIDGNYEDTVIRINASSTLIEGFTIQYGNDYYDGGGIYTRSTGNSVIIRNNRIMNNVGGLGGSIRLVYASPLIVNNWFINNKASGTTTPQGGCIDSSNSTPRIFNNIFWGNGTFSYCIAAFSNYAVPIIYNNTFVSNYRGLESTDEIDAQNNIIVNSELVGISGVSVVCPEDGLQYNDVWNNNPNYDCASQTGQNGNLSTNPYFVNAIAADFRLQSNSPLINRGNPAGAFNDLDGSRNDVGAYGGPYALPTSPIEVEDSFSHTWYDLSNWSGQTITVSFSIRDNLSNQARSEIYQTVTLPPIMDNPTLSFLYQTGQEVAAGNESFVVSIQPEVGSPTEFFISSSSYNQIWVYLDEVTIGSSHPDIWIQITGQNEALRGNEVTYTVRYGNNSSIDAEGVIITAVLPPQLTFLNASFPPSSQSPNLTWNIGDLPANSGSQSFIFTARVKNSAEGLTNAISTVNVSTTTTELETVNNSSEHSLLVGMRMYMPIIGKD